MSWKEDDTFLAKWLSGALSEEEKSAFEASEEGRDFIDLINSAKLIKPKSYDVDTALSRLKSDLGTASKGKVVRMQPILWLSVAASVILVAVFFYLFTSSTTLKTGFRDQQMAVLPDGSEVYLNAFSTLSYNKRTWDEKREVELTGEGFFNVREGSRFEVVTEQGTVAVLGTSFNVKIRAGFLDVSCYTGEVEVAALSQKRKLKKGESLRVEGGTIISFKEGTLETSPAWVGGVTKLENTAFKEVLLELEYVFGVTIEYDESLDHLKYTGAFPNDDVQAALKLVFEPLGVSYEYEASSQVLRILDLKE